MEYMRKDDITVFGEYQSVWIYDKDGNKYRNPEFISGVGYYVLGVKNSEAESINYFANKIIENLREGNNADVIMAVPSSKKKITGEGIVKTLKKVCETKDIKAIYKQCLERTKDIEKLSLGGDRSKLVHTKSLEVKNEEFIKDKVVYIYDDVTSTGNSLTVCKDLLMKSGAKEVKCFALGKTVSEDYGVDKIKNAKNIEVLDKYIQEILDNEYDEYDILSSLLIKACYMEKGFKQLDSLSNEEYYITRKRECYKYLLSQIKTYKKLTSYDGDLMEKEIIIEKKLYEKLICECGEFEYLLNLLNLYNKALNKYGYQHEYSFEMKFSGSTISEKFYIDEYQGVRFLHKNIDNRKCSSYEYNQVASALLESNQRINIEAAIKYINFAIAKDEENRILYYNKALILMKLCKVVESCKAIKDASTITRKVNEELYWFINGKERTEKWIRELNALINSIEFNRILGEFLCDYNIGCDLAYFFERRKRFNEDGSLKENITLLADEEEVLNILNDVINKSGTKHKRLTERDIALIAERNAEYKYKSKEKEYKKVYSYKKTIIDVLFAEEQRAFEYDF